VRVFFDSPCPHARGSREQPNPALRMSSPKSPLAAAPAATAPSAAGRDARAAETPRAQHDRMANAIRALAMDAVEQAKAGHPGLPMGAADIATVLFTRFLKFDPADPAWPDRDRFVLSAGHGSMLIYALLHLLGYEKMTIEEIKRFRQLGSITPGHPENFLTPGVETTTGPLGQGLGNAVGMAIAERHLAAAFGDEVVDHYTYVLASDGDLMEGVSQEAIALAGHLKLAKLIVLFDDNGISIDGPLALADSVDQVKRFEAAGWAATRVDGHDPDAIAAALERARLSDRPSLIACRTVIGFGAPSKAGTEKCHGSPLGADEIKGARDKLVWSHPAFEIPPDIRAEWRTAGQRSKAARAAWSQRLKTLAADRRAEFERRVAGELPKDRLAAAVRTLKEKLTAAPKEIATRAALENALEALTAAVPEMIGGSADLTGSNNTKAKGMTVLSAADYGGRFIHYGVREHGMAAAMNGMALHRGVIPYSGTFLVFSDYCRPSIRLAALMGERVIHVMTHDSIGLGEDGPTHQPVEHLAALRAIPNLLVFRPCDAVETVECWQLALEHSESPSVLALTRQNLPQLRLGHDEANRCAAGAYEIVPADKRAQVSLFASGSEVSIAVEARKFLRERGVAARVVSVPCFELFLALPAAERDEVIGTAPVKVAVEAAVRQGWDAIIGSDGGFVGMTGFGASAPHKDLYRQFGITPEKVAEAALAKLR
jgi:transketolase